MREVLAQRLAILKFPQARVTTLGHGARPHRDFVGLGSTPHERWLSGRWLDDLRGNRLLLSDAKTTGIPGPTSGVGVALWERVQRELPCFKENLSLRWQWV
jgi:hypothetical protein